MSKSELHEMTMPPCVAEFTHSPSPSHSRRVAADLSLLDLGILFKHADQLSGFWSGPKTDNKAGLTEHSKLIST